MTFLIMILLTKRVNENIIMYKIEIIENILLYSGAKLYSVVNLSLGGDLDPSEGAPAWGSSLGPEEPCGSAHVHWPQRALADLYPPQRPVLVCGHGGRREGGAGQPFPPAGA